MWNIIICDGNEAEREQLMALACQCLEDKEVKAQITGCLDWPELDGMVKQGMPDIVVVAQDSVEGLNTITSARLLSRKIIWFSDLDFGVQAYRLCVPFFCRKPITYKKMEQALTRLIETGSSEQYRKMGGIYNGTEI